jgi:hypothetical protein
MWFSVQGTYLFKALLKTEHYDFWYKTTILIILQTNTEQEEDSFHHQIGLKFKQETSKVLERSFIWC